MVTLKVCVGSACHVKGCYNVIGKLQELLSENALEEQLSIKAAFCLGRCAHAVSVQFEDEEAVYSVSPEPESVAQFFHAEVLSRLARSPGRHAGGTIPSDPL